MSIRLLPLAAITALTVAVPHAAASVFIGFEGLPTAPAVTSSLPLPEANGGSRVIGGVTWDEHLRVFGDQSRNDNNPLNPLHGIPHGPSFFISNETTFNGGDGMTLETPMVLTGAWFGQISYYGFDLGSLTVTVEALNGSTVLGSASVTVPANTGFNPLPMEFLDASAFLSLGPITGYRINQSPLNPGSQYWTADDFRFAAVPEPSTTTLFTAAALVTLAASRRRQPAPPPDGSRSIESGSR